LALAGAPFLSHLRRLDLSRNELTNATAFALAEAANVTGHVRLRGMRFSKTAKRALRSRYGHRVVLDD
jgi:hypothetical protein